MVRRRTIKIKEYIYIQSNLTGDDYQKGERPDYHVRVLVSPLLQEVFKVRHEAITHML